MLITPAPPFLLVQVYYSVAGKSSEMTKEHRQLPRGWYVIGPPVEGMPAVSGATKTDIVKGRVKFGLGQWLNRLHVPGAVRPLSFKDPVTENTIEVRLNPLFTVFSVNGRDYYFDRFTGRFDGTGLGC